MDTIKNINSIYRDHFIIGNILSLTWRQLTVHKILSKEKV